MKYIILENYTGKFPIIFGDAQTHSCIAAGFTMYKPISAGHCGIDANHRYYCYGDSYSLKLGVGEDDEAILNAYLLAR